MRLIWIAWARNAATMVRKARSPPSWSSLSNGLSTDRAPAVRPSMRIGTQRKLSGVATSGLSRPVRFRKSGSNRKSGMMRARPVATTLPVMPSPSAYFPRSISSGVMPAAASVRRRPVDSSSSTNAPRCMFSFSEMICIIFPNTSRNSNVDERMLPISVKIEIS